MGYPSLAVSLMINTVKKYKKMAGSRSHEDCGLGKWDTLVTVFWYWVGVIFKIWLKSGWIYKCCVFNQTTVTERPVSHNKYKSVDRIVRIKCQLMLSLHIYT